MNAHKYKLECQEYVSIIVIFKCLITKSSYLYKADICYISKYIFVVLVPIN